MASLSENPKLRITTLCLLYASQGIPYGFLHTALKPHLVSHGVTVQEMAGLIVLATLPWTFKFVWGPLIDSLGIRSMGKRRPWILFAQAGMAVSLYSMAFLGEPHLHLTALGWLLFTHNLFSSLQDVSVDALAVDMLSEKERGRANGMMYGSSVAGNSVSGVVVGYVLGSYGFATALGAQFIVLFLIFLMPLSVLERPGDRRFPWSKRSRKSEKRPPVWKAFIRVFLNLRRAFNLKSTICAGFLASASMIGYDAFATAEDNFFIKELGWSEEAMRNWKSSFLWVTVGGCLTGGFLADKLGPKKMIAGTTVALGLLLIGFGLAQSLWHTPGFSVRLLAAGALLIGLLNVSLFSLFMKVSWPVVAATQFTAFMALMNLSKTTGAWVAGPLEHHLSWPHFFIAVGAIQIGILIFLLPIDPAETRSKLGHQVPPDPNAGPGSNL